MRLVSAARPGRIAVAVVPALMTIALGGGLSAATTWTVTPGGHFSGKAGKTATDGNSLDSGLPIGEKATSPGAGGR